MSPERKRVPRGVALGLIAVALFTCLCSVGYLSYRDQINAYLLTDNPITPNCYTVVSGDTLYEIWRQELDGSFPITFTHLDGTQEEILNLDTLATMNLIHPGEEACAPIPTPTPTQSPTQISQP